MKALESFLRNAKDLNATTLGAVTLCSILVMGMMTACSGVSVAQDIVNWTPALQSAVASVDATVAVLDPVAAPIFTAATVGFDAGSNLVVAQAKAYLANPGAGALQQLQAQIVAFQQQVNAALLSVVKITDPASQTKAVADINAVATVVNSILSLVVSISTKAQLASMASASTVKLAQIEPYLDYSRAARIVAAHYGMSAAAGVMNVAIARVELTQAGF